MSKKTSPQNGWRWAGLVLVALVLLGGGLAIFSLAQTRLVEAQPAPPPPDPEVTLVAVGDIMLGREVGQLSQNDPDYPFALVKDLAGPDNLLFGNLESPLVAPEHSSQPVGNPEGYRFPAPPSAAQTLKRAGFGLVTVANNHAFDFGRPGLQDTLNSLDQADVNYVGAGNDPYTVRYIERNGLKLAFIAATQVNPQAPEQAGSQLALFDKEKLLARIREARPQADVVIVALHWGTEYQASRTVEQQDFARQASEAGADLILGAHPHVVGDFETIGHTVVAYSLGNFVFDSRYPPETRQSVALYVRLDKHGVVSALPVPLKIENDRPRPLTPAEREEGLTQLVQENGPNTDWQANSLIYNGSEWKSVPALAYNRATRADQQINLPLAQVREVQDLVGDYGGYTTGRAVDDLTGLPTVAERFTLANGQLAVWRAQAGGGWQQLWQTKPGWQVEQFTFGDADEDGRPELMFTMWKNDGWDDAGQYRSHPFVYGWRRGAFRPVWAGSALSEPIREFALADFDRDGHNELVVLEGKYSEARHDPARYVTLLRWNGWGYAVDYRGPTGQYSSLSYAPGQPYAFFKGATSPTATPPATSGGN